MPQLMPTPQEVDVRSAIDRIASFAISAQPEHLGSDIRALFKRNILDSLGCAIAGLQGKPFQALREQFGEYRAPGRCTLIGGGKTSADQAALFNSSLVRYVEPVINMENKIELAVLHQLRDTTLPRQKFKLHLVASIRVLPAQAWEHDCTNIVWA
jgi:hypothetical protein